MLFDYCRDHGIAVESYGTLALKLRWEDPIMMGLHWKYGKTAQQILLRYAIQSGAYPLFTSDNVDHITSNLQLGDFLLSEDTMKELDQMTWVQNFEDTPSVWLWETFWNCYGRAYGYACADEPSATDATNASVDAVEAARKQPISYFSKEEMKYVAALSALSG